MRKYKFLGIIAIVIILIAAFAGIIQQQTPLQGYVESSFSSSVSEIQNVEEMTPFTDSATGFTMDVPTGWTQVTIDGCPTFIHRASASSIQIQVQDYYPQVNSVTTESVSASLTNSGYTPLNFYWVDNSGYACTYTGSTQSGVLTDYIELVYFDRSNVITVLITAPDEYYSRLCNPRFTKYLCFLFLRLFLVG